MSDEVLGQLEINERTIHMANTLGISVSQMADNVSDAQSAAVLFMAIGCYLDVFSVQFIVNALPEACERIEELFGDGTLIRTRGETLQ